MVLGTRLLVQEFAFEANYPSFFFKKKVIGVENTLKRAHISTPNKIRTHQNIKQALNLQLVIYNTNKLLSVSG